MKRSARFSTALVATGLMLAACGDAEEASPATEPPAATAAPAAEGDDLTQNEGSSTEGTAADVADTAPAEVEDTAPPESAAAEEPAAEEPAAEVPATEAPVTTEPPAAAPAEAVIGGRSFAAELSPESDFAENLLPDIQVDDIRSGQKVNIRNIFPAERPVLIWAWAPH